MLTVFGGEADVSEWQGGHGVDLSRIRGDLLEDEDTERDEEPEMECKQTEMWEF